MAYDQFFHGIRVIEKPSNIRPIRSISTAILGLIAIAEDADETYFPLDTPVLITNLNEAMGKAGETGNLALSLEIIAKQTRPIMSIVRVAKGIDEAATTANIIGKIDSNGIATGLKALEMSQTLIGITPRILGCPGYDNQAVTAALAVSAENLNGMAYASDNTSTTSEAILYRANFSQRELMLIHGGFYDFDPRMAMEVAMSPVAYAMGLRAKIDNDYGWHKTLSNIGINGPLGLTHPITYSRTQAGTDSHLLNENDITALIRDDGFRFWGNRTCSDDPLFSFESSVRTAQVIKETIAEGLKIFNDLPMHPTIVRDLIASCNRKFNEWTAFGYIMGAEAYYDDKLNTQGSLSAGKLTIPFFYTDIPPIEDLLLIQQKTDMFYANFGAQLEGLN